MVKTKKTWTGKKEPTNPQRKDAHSGRKSREELVHKWQLTDWTLQLKDYNATPKV